MTSSKAALFAAVTTLALAGGASAQSREPTPADLETARGLYKQGRDLEKAGNLPGALEKLRAAHAVGRTPLTAIELAHVEVQLGLVVEAREVCLGVARMPVASDESARSAVARKDAAKLAEELKAKVATVAIQLTGVEPGAHVVVTVDGVAIPDDALTEPRRVNPGKHAIVAHVDGGAEVRGDVDLSAAETKTVTLAPPPAPVAIKPPTSVTPQPLPPQPPPPPPQPVSHRTSTAFAITGFAAAAIGLGGGVVTGVLAMNRQSELSSACAANHCPQEWWTTLDAARGLGTASTGLFVFGGVGLLTGVLAIVLRSPGHEAVTPEVGLGTVGVRGAF